MRAYHHMNAQDIELCLYETTLEPALEKVAALEAEIGLTVVNDTQLPIFRKMAASKNLHTISLDESQPMYIHVRKNHPLANRPLLPSHQLLRYPRVLLPDDFFSHLNRTVLDDSRLEVESPKRTITVNSYRTILQILRRTNGYIVGNHWQKKELYNSEICSIPLEDVSVRMNLLLLHREREEISEPVKYFLRDFLQDLDLPDIYQN